MVHLFKAACIGRHVAQDDVSLPARQQLQQLRVCGGVGDIVTGQEVGTIQRRDVEEINTNNGAEW